MALLNSKAGTLNGESVQCEESVNFLSVPGTKVTIISNGVDSNRSDPSEADSDVCSRDYHDETREQWDNPLQFFFTILGFCVGLGNIWRFPYLCQANGGGAFVLPFFIMMVIEGMPLLLLELGIGQKMRKGSFVVWNFIHPSLGGIGLGSTVIAILVGSYYNVIIAWCIFYVFNSFQAVLPWSVCPTALFEFNQTFSLSKPVTECALSSETQYFWYRETLDISSSIDVTDGIRWWMLICLILSWIIVYFTIMKGIKSSGKVVYFTALFPYIVLTIFFIRGITLKGSFAGLAHMFYPKIDKLYSPSVWLEAANQVFYSYGLAFGSIIGFGSYNPPNKNCIRDVYLITVFNGFTALYACAVIFAILGFKAQHLLDICKVEDLEVIANSVAAYSSLNITEATDEFYRDLMVSGTIPQDLYLKNCTLEDELESAAQGTGLAFIVMADVFTKLPGAPFWSLLFFAMLLTLGLGSQIGILEGLLGTIFDIPQFKHISKPVLSGLACLFCFMIGLLFTTGSGEYWLTLFDKYGAMGLTLIAFVEIISVMYVYGHEKFTNDLHKMTGTRPGFYWQFTWRFLAPLTLAIILVASIAGELISSSSYSAWNMERGRSEMKSFPSWALWIAAGLAIASVIPIVLVAALSFFKMDFFTRSITHRASVKNKSSVSSSRSMKPIPTVTTFTDMGGHSSDEDMDKVAV
ncbi:hypothetical protein TCAL_11438 [Tigriopus californicus]|uniref:Transporter n=1 Tax=Tigriopus californicus TaxID=6832 RepID=A0A553NQI5_TIGCA|nr:sodium- and chloride-dependent transporter XTRP3-like isoform X2 [Tigriopus californicus]TRY67705.1 hypothetical protein TCAL_11438 [Tigriopus californicus]